MHKGKFGKLGLTGPAAGADDSDDSDEESGAGDTESDKPIAKNGPGAQRQPTAAEKFLAARGLGAAARPAQPKAAPVSKPQTRAAADDSYSDDLGADDSDDEDALELSASMPTKGAAKAISPSKRPAPAAPPKEASVMSGSFGKDAMDDYDEKDMLASGSLDQLEFEHVEVKDPEREKGDRDVKEKLGKIPSKFNAPAAKAKAKKPVVSPTKAPAPAKAQPARPATAKPVAQPRAQSGARASSAARPQSAKPVASKPQPKPKPAGPTEQDLENQKRAAARAKQNVGIAQKAAQAATAKPPPKKNVDPVKLQAQIRATQKQKKEELVGNI